jgi:hypothetical protein
MAGSPARLKWRLAFDEPAGRTSRNEAVEGYHTNFKIFVYRMGSIGGNLCWIICGAKNPTGTASNPKLGRCRKLRLVYFACPGHE